MSGIRPGLQRISKLLAATDLPWKAIHVGGTNGKGSVCAYISAMLECYNQSAFRETTAHRRLVHGRFTSPHLVNRHDCIVLNQQTISQSAFAFHESRVQATNTSGKIGASSFETLTATAFRYFSESNTDGPEQRPADLAVIEVGMGGRDDATNILGQRPAEDEAHACFRALPLVTAFTKIGLDHQGFLGNTLQEITMNKAGIMKTGVPVVFDQSNDPIVRSILAQAAKDRLVPASIRPLYRQAFHRLHGNRIDCSTSRHKMENLAVAFESTWTALTGLDRLPRLPGSICQLSPDEQAQLGLLADEMIRAAENTAFPGRLQYLDIGPITGRTSPVLLDGAHNPQSALVLAQESCRLRCESGSENTPITWVLAATDSKDVIGIIDPLLRRGDAVFPVEFGPVDGMPWVKPLPSETLGQAARQVCPEIDLHQFCGDLHETLYAACQHAKSGPLVIAGSLYLVGDVLRLLELFPEPRAQK